VESDFLFTRRHVVRGGAAAIAAATAPSRDTRAFTVGHHQSVVTGVVFEDLSGTGRRQPSDPGIPDVLVSNGRDVVRTDGDGRYTLPLEENTIIFVIKPTGYAVPIDRSAMLPRFYYIHRPHGTPPHLRLRERGIEPTGQLPRSVDFGLTKVDESHQFDVIMFADTHADSPTAIDYIRTDVVNALTGTTAAFGLTLGDLMSDDLSLYERYNRIIGQMGIPWYNISGNHDLNFEASSREYSRETFKRIFGPDYYAIEYGGALFLMLDNVDYLGNGRYRGQFGERQLAFVSQVIEHTPANRLVVAAMHIPLRSYLDPDDPTINTSDGLELLRILGNRPCISFAGHTHTTEHHYIDSENGSTESSPHHHHVMTALSGSWWSGPYDHRGVAVADSPDGNPNGFHVLSVDGHRYTTRFRPAKEPEGRQIRTVLDNGSRAPRTTAADDVRMSQLFGAPISQDRICDTDVVVNVFDGGPRTTVEYRIGEFGPVAMNREMRPDPFIQEVFAKNQATKKPWADVEQCSHIWTARLPANLEVGAHCVMVRVIDEYGREHHDRLCLEVTGTKAVRATLPG